MDRPLESIDRLLRGADAVERAVRLIVAAVSRSSPPASPGSPAGSGTGSSTDWFVAPG